MAPIIIRAHFDGEKVVLDDPINLQADTQLLVTVLPDSKRNGKSAEGDKEYEDWLQLSMNGLEYAFGANEDGYSLDLIKEPNPDYEGG